MNNNPIPPLSFTPSHNLTTALIEAAQAATEHGGTLGTIYLLHFERPYRHARHYTGFAIDLDARLAAHLKGRGSRLTAVVKAAGITWQLARTWTGTRHTERALKQQGGASRRCPLCGPKTRTPEGTQP